jgi:hypothetical protein
MGTIQFETTSAKKALSITHSSVIYDQTELVIMKYLSVATTSSLHF